MADTFKFGQGPAPEVLQFIEGKGLAPSFDWRDFYGEEHAYAFTVAKATQIDVLSQIHRSTLEAIKEGLPLAEFQKRLTPELKSMGWWGKQDVTDPKTGNLKTVQLGSQRRLKTIYWANTRTAYSAGKWTRIQRTKLDLPYLVYRLGQARKHRPEHEEKEYVVLPVDHSFWDSWYPVNGWGCVCWVLQVTAEAAKTLGGVSPDPDIPNVRWMNERTGKVEYVPQGIDAGWNNNAGKTRHRNLAAHLAGKLDEAPDHIRKVAMRDLVTSQLFTRIQKGDLTGKKVFAPVAVIPEHAKAAIGSSTRIAFLSTDDAVKQQGKRSEVSAKDYLLAQRLLDEGEIRQESNRDLIAQGALDGLLWRAVFRTNKNGDEIFLKSLRRSNERQMKTYQSRGEVIAP